MATYTSTQSGPFDVASTWGGAGVPGDGDSFNVSQGHIVAVTGDSRPTNGFENSNVYGKLHIQGSGCKLRMNGTLLVDSLTNAYFTEGSNSAPFFRMDPGSTLELRGTNTDAHRLYIRNEDRIQVEIEGTNPNPQTTITADVPPSGNAGPISFADASDFAPGDWFTVYQPDRNAPSWAHNRSDETFWIHDIDGNNIYYKQYVGPEATITAVSGNKIVVDDASVFRKGYNLIFGTGNNRNVKTATNIVYGTNTITFDSSITGSVVGEKIYQTGANKYHISGDKVLRLAAVTTVDAAVGDNTITVNNTNGFSVGDMILIQPNSNNYSEVAYWDYIMDYTITDINTVSKTITFTNGYTSPTQTTLQKVTNAGALVVNATRDTKIIAPEGTTYGSDQRSSIFFQGTGTYNYRRMRIKNVLINIGSHSDYNNYAMVGIRGTFSYRSNGEGNYVSEFEGNVLYPVTRERLMGYVYEQHQLTYRNNVFYNSNRESAIFFGNSCGWIGNIHLRLGGWSVNNQTGYYSAMEFSHNFTACCGAGIYISQWGWTGSKDISYNRMINVGSVVGGDYFYGSTFLYRLYADRYHSPPGMAAQRKQSFYTLDSYLGNSWDVTNPNGAGTFVSYSWQGSIDTNQAANNLFGGTDILNYSACDNFKYNGMRQYTRTEMRIWDENEQAWRVYPDFDYASSSYAFGFSNTFFLPSNSIAFIVGQVKRAYSGTTNYPYIWVGQAGDLWQKGRFRGYDGVTDANLAITDPRVNGILGFDFSDRFTSAMNNDYERRVVTIGPFTEDKFICTGIMGWNITSGELRRGWYEKDLEIIINTPQGIVSHPEGLNRLTTRKPIRYKQTADETQTIWGG